MAIFIPDLFGSYVDGREKAIDSNWKDMKNYNDVLGGQLGNAKTMATFDSDVLNHKGQGLSSFAHGKTDYDKSKLDTLLLKYMLNGATANGGAWMAQYAANKLNGLNANAAASPCSRRTLSPRTTTPHGCRASTPSSSSSRIYRTSWSS